MSYSYQIININRPVKKSDKQKLREEEDQRLKEQQRKEEEEEEAKARKASEEADEAERIRQEAEESGNSHSKSHSFLLMYV